MKDEFYVVEGNSEALLGVNSCQVQIYFTINVPRSQFLNRQRRSVQQVLIHGSQTFSESNIYINYSRVFEGLDRIPFECNIQLDKSISPVVHPPRHVAITLQERLRGQIDLMVTSGVIASLTATSTDKS